MQRFYLPTVLTPDMTVTEPRLVHQVSHVMRSRIGDEIILFSGDGWENVYSIKHIDKSSVSLRGVNTYRNGTENVQKIHLFQAIPNKYEKIEYIIEKGVEVGISAFTFFASDFSQKLVISDHKKERFSSIAREALEQSGGPRFPDISFRESMDFAQVFDTPPLVLHTNVQLSNHKCSLGDTCNFFVGPEGGWSENELGIMGNYGFIFVHFQGRILRTETASSVFAFSVLHANEINQICL